MQETIVDSVSRVYRDTGSMRRTANQLGIGYQKVKKILITIGQYSNTSVKQAGEMMRSGKTIAEIAAALHISERSAWSLLPYSKCMYNALYASKTALRIRKCRRRKAEKASQT